ncbi:3-isopropylmalate dehydratase large subunit [Acetivibrio sp. MSJd-27]|uniref:3-isopropylmalate dehydratase large subunit n=1 Tax=Acetivibrio sp. MSJd-27 TaxID=2841523 RepID=UPI0015B0B302|nr:3-isopropylmalate dehydratase large subunit [Acetivibrio sp. MSJd-27]MBU5451047.1 3-isopropylmalate dehydratase large subunit [Acetivibrio sp. MSJd-27]
MGMTMSQKILAEKSGFCSVKPGELIKGKLDLVLGNDITSPVAIKEFDKAGFQEVFDKDKIALVLDHFTPNKDIKSAEQCKFVREFAAKHRITHFYEGGNVGVEHAILPEKGLTVPGDLIIGADSHTCTYGALNAFSTGIGSTDMAVGMATGEAWFKVPEAIQFKIKGQFNKYVSGKDLILYIIGQIGVDGALYQSMEFTGAGISNMTMDDRFTIANMAIEAGGKNGIFQPDEIMLNYVKEHSEKPYTTYEPDADAEYRKTIEIDLSDLASTVAFPHLPSNTKDIYEAEKCNVKVNQVVIGSCTNGRYSDLKMAADILKGKKVRSDVRTLIIPATPKIYTEALKTGLLEIFMDAGCIVSPPTCGPCLGGHMGILAKGERCVSTTNRNFVGRMGHVNSEVYLASPAVAAASALTGYITDPNRVM